MYRLAIGLVLLSAAGCGPAGTSQGHTEATGLPRQTAAPAGGQTQHTDTRPAPKGTHPATQKRPEPPEEQGQVFAPKEANFQVRFPGAFVEKTTPSGEETVHVAGAQRKAVGELGYVCQWLVKPRAFDDKKAVEDYLLGQQEGCLRLSKGKLLAEAAIDRDGVPGREFTIEVSANNVCRFRVYVAGARVIDLQVWGKDREAVSSESATRFLESLKIAK
jgi:hypothetical protein